MEKIREALLRAREDEEFRAAHPVSELPDRQRSPDGGQKESDVPRPPDEPAAEAGTEKEAGPQALPEESAGSERSASQSAGPEPERLSAAAPEILGEPEPAEPDAEAPKPAVGQAAELPEGAAPGAGESAIPAAQFDLAPIPAAEPDVRTVTEQAADSERLVSGSRLLRIVAYLGFGAALLTGVHFFIEPLGPYLDLGLEYVDMIAAAGGPVWELVSTYIAAGAETIESLLRDLFG